MRQLSFGINASAIPLSSGMRRGTVVKSTRGSMTEVIVGEGSALQPFQLLPILAHCNDHQRWLMWLSPNQAMNKQWLLSAGLQDSPVLHMGINAITQLDLCVKALQSAKSHLIVEWTGELNATTRIQLRDIAEQNGTHLFLIRGE